MNWAESFSILFAFIGLALVFNGFPDIKIGGKHDYHINDEND